MVKSRAENVNIVESEEASKVGKSLLLKRDIPYLGKGMKESFIGKKFPIWIHGSIVWCQQRCSSQSITTSPFSFLRKGEMYHPRYGNNINLCVEELESDIIHFIDYTIQ